MYLGNNVLCQERVHARRVLGGFVAASLCSHDGGLGLGPIGGNVIIAQA
jgi:hypothetical protein